MGALDTRAIAAHCDEIRSTMGILALLQAGGELGNRDMANAVSIVERELNAIAAVAAGRAIALPVMTLADVVASARHRSGDYTSKRAQPDLHAIEGGLSS
jgi:hypothetical protein